MKNTSAITMESHSQDILATSHWKLETDVLYTYQSQLFGAAFLPFYLLSVPFSPISGGNPFENAADNYALGRGSWFPTYQQR